MRVSRSSASALLGLMALLFVSQQASAQLFVYPRRPTKSTVRNFEFDWRHVDLQIAPTEGSKREAGDLRLYFYEREREVAERSIPIIASAYRDLVEDFNVVPPERFPFILYSSYQEFLQTTLFPLQEGTLGVTSPMDLKLTLPYFGDPRLFDEVATHELAHQFTIQKIRVVEQASGSSDAVGTIQGFPLWFIEGMAEYYAKDGFDDEAQMLVRDLLVNPDVLQGYAFLDFFTEGPPSFLWIYKVGQARIAFLEETYGAGFVQKVLEKAPRLAGVGGAPVNFQGLLQELGGDPPERVSARFEYWLKERGFANFLEARQGPPSFELLPEQEGIVTGMAASPDGKLLAYKSLDMITAGTQLYLVDPQNAREPIKVVNDGRPGYESLHPLEGRNFDLRNDRIVFVAEAGRRDRIFLQTIEREEGGEAEGDAGVIQRPLKLSLGDRVEYPLARGGLLAAFSPAFSPDGSRIAFIGLDESGTRDLYVLTPRSGEDYDLERITRDPYGERQLSWGPKGIIYTSDATSHRQFNLFQVAPEGGEPTRLTTEARDEFDPVMLPDGRIFFSAYADGRADLHEWTPEGIVQRTRVTTGLFNTQPGSAGSLWNLFHHAGRRRIARVRASALLSNAPVALTEGGPAGLFPTEPITADVPYNGFAGQNIELGPILGFAGAGPGGIIGQLFGSASDRLREHAMLLSLAVYGSFELTDGLLLYLNQRGRITWGTGLFQSLRFRFDTLPDAPNLSFQAGERFLGALGSARYPFNTFTFAELELGIGGTRYFLLPGTRLLLGDPAQNGVGDLLPAWEDRFQGFRFQTEVTGRIGYDTLKYASLSGPITGTGVLAEAVVDVQPIQNQVFGSLRFDAEKYFLLFGRTHFLTRIGVGSTFGGEIARAFFLSSFDTIRGARFADERFLLGRQFLFSTAELQVPLDSIIRVLFLSEVEGIVGMDFGGVGSSFRNAWDGRILNFVAGANFGLGPILLRLHFARPISTGAARGPPVPEGEWVTNFSIRIAGFEGLFDDRLGKRPGPAAPAAFNGFVAPRF